MVTVVGDVRLRVLIKILRNLPAVETKYRGQRNTLIFVSSLRLVRKEKKNVNNKW